MKNCKRLVKCAWIYISYLFLLTFFTCYGVSENETSFEDLCRFEGMCLNCTEGGCEDMCNFYDNNCCLNSAPKSNILKKWQYSCVRKFPDMYDLHLDCRGSFNGVYGVYMVTKCSVNWTDDLIKNKCENDLDEEILSRIPVFDKTHEIVTYTNMYCAFCNMINLKNLRFWKFDLMCNSYVRIDEIGNDVQPYDENCFIRLVYRQHRMCAIDVIESCDKNENYNVSIKDRCEKGLHQYAYVWKTERVFNVYKNEFCAMCNSEVGELQCWAFQAFTCWPQNLPPYTNVLAKINLDFNDNSNTDSIGLYKNTCGMGVVYNPFSKTCLNITCLQSQNICVSGECHLVQFLTSDVIFLNDSSLYVHAIDDFIQIGRYFVTDSKVHACLDDEQFSEFELIQKSTLQTTDTTATSSHSVDATPLKSNATTVTSSSNAVSKVKEAPSLLFLVFVISKVYLWFQFSGIFGDFFLR